MYCNRLIICLTTSCWQIRGRRFRYMRIHKQSMNHISVKKDRPRCYTKSPTAQDTFQPIPCLISCTGKMGTVTYTCISCKKCSQMPSIICVHLQTIKRYHMTSSFNTFSCTINLLHKWNMTGYEGAEGKSRVDLLSGAEELYIKVLSIDHKAQTFLTSDLCHQIKLSQISPQKH